MNHKKKLVILSILAALFIALFLCTNVTAASFSYIMYRRIPKLIAIILTAVAIAVSAVLFQTTTHNHILTPSVLGLDSLYLLVQTLIVFILGQSSFWITNRVANFLLSLGAMIIFSIVIFKVLMQKGRDNIYFLLLIGFIFGGLFQSISSFMQMIIDPNEFQALQDKMFASFNNVSTELIGIAAILMVFCIVYVWDYIKQLDVIALGRDEAIGLGVSYDKVVKKMLVVVAILVSVSTALVGPITFLSILVVNIARQYMKTYKHSYFIVAAGLIGIIALVGGQWLVEQVLQFKTTISVLINFIGGVYFIYLLLKEGKHDTSSGLIKKLRH